MKGMREIRRAGGLDTVLRRGAWGRRHCSRGLGAIETEATADPSTHSMRELARDDSVRWAVQRSVREWAAAASSLRDWILFIHNSPR